MRLSDGMLMSAVKHSLDSTAVVLASKRIGCLNENSSLIMKEALLVDFSHNSFNRIQSEFFAQYPQAWWCIFRDNKVRENGALDLLLLYTLGFTLDYISVYCADVHHCLLFIIAVTLLCHSWSNSWKLHLS